ncbi:hypothetical protein EJD97_008293, partial [Solanum chilense]
MICWNARSINTFGALERLINLRKIHNLSLIAILEPFTNHSQIESYRLQLLMNKSHSNPNNKIWLFWTNEVIYNILESSEQHITCEISHDDCSEKFLMTFVYAKCKDHLRKLLWESMLKWSAINYP